jgi:hypothetical protein
VGKGEIGGADHGVILRQRLSPLAASVTDLHGASCLRSLGLQCLCPEAQAGEGCSNCSFSLSLDAPDAQQKGAVFFIDCHGQG